uniref:Uncharacterized protein n=1 Tax=Sphaerodactylus townsendi TaxID=933632 RepID=A0ACB8EV10_9SAUR
MSIFLKKNLSHSSRLCTALAVSTDLLPSVLIYSGSGRSCVTASSVSFLDGIQDGSAAEEVRGGSSVAPNAAGLGGIVDLPQCVQRFRLGVFEQISLALWMEKGRQRSRETVMGVQERK